MKNIIKYMCLTLCLFLMISTFCGCGNSAKLKNQINQTKFDSKVIDVSKISSYNDLVSTVKPAVVGIACLNDRYQSIGTGVCIKKGAYILTNNHVIENGGTIKLYLSDGNVADAIVTWTDGSSDLAMLKSSKDIPYLPMASSGSYASGDEVIAIGTPLDLAFKHSTTKGIISATNRTISVDNTFGESTLYNLIQHDASINPGNSGGPLINMKGEVIGINTVKVTSAEGMGFAIPVDTFSVVVDKVSANGSYDTTYMGIFGFDNQFKHIGKQVSGFYVQSVAAKSPAEKIGLLKGDVITTINGKIIGGASNIKREMYRHEVGEEISIGFEREGKIYTKKLILTRHPYSFSATKLLTKN